ncbi:helix-turn-helix domain-containing protein [Balneola vulgaris]|jgi:AraC-like DNA-binding protein|uniref:helix-turn-helix domain-containing protein n=1 Tax=Balneola vulgaris TaxID=287535 RepID=UPI000376C18E|nr:helix-turn-helix domain-containing protein [Balneola vulgaris]
MIIEIVFLLGAIHGLFLALILALKKTNQLPNKLLALLMLVFSIDLGMAAFYNSQLLSVHPMLIGIDFPITLLYGPLLFLYVKLMRDGSDTLTVLDYLHFIPFVVLLIYMIPFFIEPGNEKLAFTKSSMVQANSFGFNVLNNLKIVHGLAYALCLYFMLNSYRKKLKNSYSSIEKINLNWLQNIVMGAIVLALVAGSIHFFSASNTLLMGSGEGLFGNINLLFVTAFIYSIGYMGLYQSEVFSNSEIVPQVNKRTLLQDQYQKSGLNKNEAEQYVIRIKAVMEEQKIYQQNDLKLSDLAKELSLTPHNLTQILNQYLDKSFYDFINHYRVEEVKKKLLDSEMNNKTFYALALEAGFNSKSSFNSVFKKHTGMTPSEFKKRNL